MCTSAYVWVEMCDLHPIIIQYNNSMFGVVTLVWNIRSDIRVIVALYTIICACIERFCVRNSTFWCVSDATSSLWMIICVCLFSQSRTTFLWWTKPFLFLFYFQLFILNWIINGWHIKLLSYAHFVYYQKQCSHTYTHICKITIYCHWKLTFLQSNHIKPARKIILQLRNEIIKYHWL